MFNLPQLPLRNRHVGISIRPALSGCLCVAASFLTWLRDPLGTSYSAWQLPLDLGWQFHVTEINYGLLCLACAGVSFAVAVRGWKAEREQRAARRYFIESVVCFIPVGLFVLQFLVTDLHTIDLFAQHKNQLSLLSNHFGYSQQPEMFPMKAFSIDISDVGIRYQLFIDQLQVGAPVMLLAALLACKTSRHLPAPGPRPVYALLTAGVVLLLLLVVGRAAAGMVSESQASDAISRGEYAAALQWLDRAAFFHPSLEQAAFYHIERGHALFLLNPNQQSDDNRAYIASLLMQQRNFQDAYQQLSLVLLDSQHAPWAVEEMSETLEYLVESSGPAKVQYTVQNLKSTIRKDSMALPWVYLLIQVDPGNVYGQYMLGRIDYELQNYAASKTQLMAVLRLAPDAYLQSSAYTYIALSDRGLGEYAEERTSLLMAAQLDPGYRNIIAREALSGLH